MTEFTLTDEHRAWVTRADKKYHIGKIRLESLIREQNGLCNLTKAPLRFDIESGTPIKGGKGCHPLYAALDHINPSQSDLGYQILCYDINDLKGHIPPFLFDSLKATNNWGVFKNSWKSAAESDPNNIEQLKQIIKNGR